MYRGWSQKLLKIKFRFTKLVKYLAYRIFQDAVIMYVYSVFYNAQ